MHKDVIIYDSDCRLCTAFKNRVVKRDNFQIFHFISRNSTLGIATLKELPLKETELNTIIYIQAGNYFTKSDAIIKIYERLRQKSPIPLFIRIFPRFIRNFFYDLIAKHRHSLFN